MLASKQGICWMSERERDGVQMGEREKIKRRNGKKMKPGNGAEETGAGRPAQRETGAGRDRRRERSLQGETDAGRDRCRERPAQLRPGREETGLGRGGGDEETSRRERRRRDVGFSRPVRDTVQKLAVEEAGSTAAASRTGNRRRQRWRCEQEIGAAEVPTRRWVFVGGVNNETSGLISFMGGGGQTNPAPATRRKGPSVGEDRRFRGGGSRKEMDGGFCAR